MPELLALMTRKYDSRRTSAILYQYHSIPPKLFVLEHFDNGNKGALRAFWDEDTPVTEEVFQKALDERYISGKLKSGCFSICEFLITDQGELAYAKNVKIADEALNNLYPGKDMRACDIHVYVPDSSEEEVGAVLEELVRRGYAESGELGGQKFYRLAEHRAAAARAIAV